MTEGNLTSTSPPTTPRHPAPPTINLTPATPPHVPLTGYSPPPYSPIGKPPPAEIYPFHALQTKDKMDKIVNALRVHDLSEAFKRGTTVINLAQPSRVLRHHLGGIPYTEQGPSLGDSHPHSRQVTDESVITIRPTLDTQEGSETERDEPKEKEGKKGKKKKNKKKKKGKGVMPGEKPEKDEDEVDQLLTDLKEIDLSAVYDDEYTVELGPVDEEKVDPDATMVDPDATMVVPSADESEASGVDIITSDSPAIPLPEISPIEDEKHEVTVRLPTTHTRHATHTTIKVEEENPIVERSVDFLPLGKLPLTPPHSPPTEPQVVKSTMQRPATPPLDDPAIASTHPEGMPLSDGWTLYHSNTGTPAIAQIVKLPRNQAAEDFSHGLTPLFTADNVIDLLGTWKALRRKIAHRWGRIIEPEDMPIAKHHEGLGIVSLPDDRNFHFFLQKVKPMWEDPMCVHGGKVMLTGPPGQLDSAFFQLILLLAGGTFDEYCHPPEGKTSRVVGTVISKRRVNTRIEVWLGAREPLQQDWIHAVERFLAGEFEGLKFYPFVKFGQKGHAERRVQRLPSLGNDR